MSAVCFGVALLASSNAADIEVRGWSKGASGKLLGELARAKSRDTRGPRWPAGNSKPRVPLPVAANLDEQLRKVPEVDLVHDYLKLTKTDIAKLANDIRAETAASRDAYVLELRQKRLDLAGLPFQLGQAAQLRLKEARELEQAAHDIRQRLSVVERVVGTSAEDRDRAATRFWSHASFDSDNGGSENLPTLAQIIFAEAPAFRALLIRYLAMSPAPAATRLIAQRAVFDPDERVRAIAIQALRLRASWQAMPVLLEGLRYPWPAAVRHAAEAVAALSDTEVVPQLVDMLDEPSPGTPFITRDKEGPGKWVARELVRINHHRNCLLCHPPAHDPPRRNTRFPADTDEMVLAPAPIPGDALPPPTTPDYHGFRSGDIVVRADITYLRQDFSLMQKVENHGKWPAMQRFDFLVRTRELTDKEAAEARQRPKPALSEYHDTIVWALRELTGLDAPPVAATWRALLAGQIKE